MEGLCPHPTFVSLFSGPGLSYMTFLFNPHQKINVRPPLPYPRIKMPSLTPPSTPDCLRVATCFCPRDLILSSQWQLRGNLYSNGGNPFLPLGIIKQHRTHSHVGIIEQPRTQNARARGLYVETTSKRPHALTRGYYHPYFLVIFKYDGFRIDP